MRRAIIMIGKILAVGFVCAGAAGRADGNGAGGAAFCFRIRSVV